MTMRWTANYHGKIRYVKRFALLPIKIDHEVRWLETCYIRQYWHEYYGWWLNTEFITEETYKRIQGESTDE